MKIVALMSVLVIILAGTNRSYAAMLSIHTYVYNGYDVEHEINKYSYSASARGKLTEGSPIYPYLTVKTRIEGVLVSYTYGVVGTYDSGTVEGPKTGFEVNASSGTTAYTVNRVAGTQYIAGTVTDTMNVY